MAKLPTAYASQNFGSKSLDFYAVGGDVVGADPRARADERRLQDMDGSRHTVRLMESGFGLEPGDQATVLRLQPGPNHRSRPVAVINHTAGSWSRTHPGVSGVLSRAGIARNVNWWLTLSLFALAALVVVWPYLGAFIAVMMPSAGETLPMFNVFDLAAFYLPQLSDWSYRDTVAPLSAAVEAQLPQLTGMVPALSFLLIVLLCAIVVFSARSWRLLWAPLLVVGIGAIALGFGDSQMATLPALLGLGLVSVVFIMGGLFNRIIDGMRLERRIALLAEHVLTETPVHPRGSALSDIPAMPSAPLEETASQDDDAAVAVTPIATDEALSDQTLRSDTTDTLDGEAEEIAVDEVEADADADEAGDAELDTKAETDEQDGEPEVVQETDEPVAIADTEETVAEDTPSDDSETQPDDGEVQPVTAEVAQADASEENIPEGEDADAEARAEETDLSAPDDAAETTGVPEAETAEIVSSGDSAENERLKNDPRYAARAIVLPPPPPMPGEEQASDASGSDVAEGESPNPQGEARETQTLKTEGPLPSNVVPMFGARKPDDLKDG